MNRITIPLSRMEWQQLTSLLLALSEDCAPKLIGHLNYKDRYLLAMRNDLLKCVYIKLHNKLHSLKVDKNILNITVPEAATLGLWLQENCINFSSFAFINMIEIIDKKLV